MATISVCMIVKNEEKLLARCLTPLAEIADEIIVVDTGSADSTKEIARRFTDKVFDFEWVEDFAAARNFSLEKASCDYIYTADADEVIDERNLLRFSVLKEALLPEVEVVEMAYEHTNQHVTTSNFGVEYRPKLFRRLREFRFMDPVHEVLRTEPVVYRSDVVVHHCPENDHGGRDLAHFASLVKQGRALSARLQMMYARELMMTGCPEDFTAAVPYFAEVFDTAPRTSDAARQAACVLGQQAAREGDCAALLRFAAPPPGSQPPAELCCALGEYFLRAGDIQQAVDWYGAALAAPPELVAAAGGRIPFLGLAACFTQAGDQAQADEFRAQAEAWDPDALNPDK